MTGRSSMRRSRASRAIELVELYIPDASPIPITQPDSSLCGVGITDTLRGLVVAVPPYAGMTIGDDVRVYWDIPNIDVVSTAVTEDDLGQELVMKIPRDVFVSGISTPFYRVYKLDGEQYDSPSREIQVKLDLPGGTDPDRNSPYNENLAAPQLPSEVQVNGVDATQAVRGVDVTIQPYENMAQYDYIRLAWGGVQLTHIVLPGGAGQPVVIHVDNQAILDAGDGEICVLYQVIDAVGNFSDGWSMTTTVNVFAGAATLAAPIVADADANNIVDLSLLNGQDVTVEVWATSPDFAVGDTVNLLWAGHTENGAQVNWTASQAVSKVPDTMEFAVPNATVAAIAQGYAVVSYTLTKKVTGKQLASKRTQVMIGGESATNLPAPTVLEAERGILAHDAPQATVQIAPYSGMAPGDNIDLTWAGTRADGSSTDYRASRPVSGGSVGTTITFIVPSSEIAILTGGNVDVSYKVTPAGGTTQQSAHLVLWISGVPLAPPVVPEATDGVLAPDTTQATVEIAAYPRMAINDRVDLLWQGDVTGLYTDWLPVTSVTVNKPLAFAVSSAEIAPNHSIVVSYSVTRADGSVETSEVLPLRIGDASVPPGPTIDEAQGTTLDPADVPNGATARMPASAQTQAGDRVTMHWRGPSEAGTTEIAQDVTTDTAGKDLTFVIAASVVQACSGTWITLDYVIDRTTGTLASEASIYDIAAQVSIGTLRVMGARSARPCLANQPQSNSHLVALNAQTLSPVSARWQYAGQASSLTADTFRDLTGSALLQVTGQVGTVTLSPANLCGNVGAMVAIRDTHDLVAWGDPTLGGSLPANVLTLNDIVEVTAAWNAFTARRGNGAVVAWGNTDQGGTVPDDIASLTDIEEVAGSGFAFAVRRKNGSVKAWGDASAAGRVPVEVANLTDVVALTGSGWNAFAAQSSDGSVRAWGDPVNGGDVTAEVLGINDIIEVIGGGHGFAARRSNGTVVAWGDPLNGGLISAEVARLTDIVEVTGGGHAFAVRRANGRVNAWGYGDWGGTIPQAVATLDDVVALTGNNFAFVALRANGSVVAWGRSEAGGQVPSSIANLNDIVHVAATHEAFAVLRATGEVMAWGLPGYGDSTAAVQSSLVNVRAIYGGTAAFAAVRDGGIVVTWGSSGGGGNSSAMSNLLNGHVSYEMPSGLRRTARRADESSRRHQHIAQQETRKIIERVRARHQPSST